jgi:hypothetical protein
VRRLQIFVAAIERIPLSIVIEADRFGRVVQTQARIAPTRFVDVVAEMQDGIDIVGEHVSICTEVAMLELLARRDGKSQLAHDTIASRGGACAPDCAACAA